MADTLEIFGVEYTNVTGIIATDDNGNELTFTRGGGSYTWETIIDQSITIASDASPNYFIVTNYTTPFMADETYRVTWGSGGTEYICTTQSASTGTYDGYYLGNASIVGLDADTGEPFFMYRDSATRLLGATTRSAGSWHIKIEKQVSLSATLITKTITTNGTYDAEDDDADGYSSVTVNVSGGQTTRIVVPEQTATPTAASPYQEIDFDESLILGEEYIVTINGVTRYITATDIYGSIGVIWTTDKLMIEYVANNNKMYLSGVSADVQDIAYTVKVEKVTGGGGSPSATQHTIHLEFSDSTDTDINVYYDDSLIGAIITAYEPSTWTYNNKTVYVAELDGTEWYNVTPLPYTWTTLFEGNASFASEQDDSYTWISSLASETITEGSVWRVTWGNETKIHNAVYGAPWSGASNRWHINSTTDGTNGVYVITPFDSNAWVFIDFDDLSAHNKYVKLEKATT